jgi:hypothetical protein
MKNVIEPEERARLLKQREQLVQEVTNLKSNAPGPNEPAFRHRFHDEDLKSLARRILLVDKRLGR